jgi:hypothetical protein
VNVIKKGKSNDLPFFAEKCWKLAGLNFILGHDVGCCELRLTYWLWQYVKLRGM